MAKDITRSRTTPTSSGAPDSLRVRATQDGFYGVGEGASRIRKGQRFTLKDPTHFSEKWMERVPESEPDDVEQLRQAAHTRPTRRRPDAVYQPPTPASPSSDSSKPTGDQDVLGDDRA